MNALGILVLFLASASLCVEAQQPTFVLAPRPGVTSEGVLWSPNMYWRLVVSNRCGPLVIGQMGGNDIGWRLTDDSSGLTNTTFWSGFVQSNLEWNLNLNVVADQNWAPGMFLARGTFAQRGTANEMLSSQCAPVNAIGTYTRWFFRGAYALAISNGGVLLRKTVQNVWAPVTDLVGFVFTDANQVQMGLNWRGPDWIRTNTGFDIMRPALSASLPPPSCATISVVSALVDTVVNQCANPLQYTRSLALTQSQSTQVADTFSNSLTVSISVSAKTGNDNLGGSVTVSVGTEITTARSTTFTNTNDFSRTDTTSFALKVPVGATLKVYNETATTSCTYQSNIAWTFCHTLFNNLCYFIPLQMPLTVTSRNSYLRFSNN